MLLSCRHGYETCLSKQIKKQQHFLFITKDIHTVPETTQSCHKKDSMTLQTQCKHVLDLSFKTLTCSVASKTALKSCCVQILITGWPSLSPCPLKLLLHLSLNGEEKDTQVNDENKIGKIQRECSQLHGTKRQNSSDQEFSLWVQLLLALSILHGKSRIMKLCHLYLLP